MSMLIGAAAAADLLGITPATLYAYVSRGKITRQRGPDGRSSLFSRDDVDALAARSRNAPRGAPPSIDVRIGSSITKLDEDGVTIRGHSLTDLVRRYSFEAIAELLWSGEIGTGQWPASDRSDRAVISSVASLPILDGDPVGRMAIAAHALSRPDDGGPAAARRLLLSIPQLLGSTRQTGPYARRLAHAWDRRPSDHFVASIDVALGLLADHELATSTLAVRVAASVRASPYAAYGAGMSTVQGPLHGAAADHAHRFLNDCARNGVVATVAQVRNEHRRLPGFGHKIYRGPDPRFSVLRGVLDDSGPHAGLLDEVVAEVGRATPLHPNIDLALGALTFNAGLPGPVPIFAIARIAGWAAHYAEELDAPPVRYRGVSG